MRNLNTLLDNAFNEKLNINNVLVQLMIHKLRSIGVVFDADKLELLENKLLEQVEASVSSSDTITIEFDDEFIEQLSEALKEEITELRITSEDIDEFEDIFEKKIQDGIPELIFAIADEMIPLLKADAEKYLKKRRKENHDYSKRLLKTWQKPMDLLEILLVISYELGSDFNHFYRPTLSKESDFIFDALTRLHARGCQVANEIILLMSNGFADGAHARWRTLHEITITANFISHNGQEIAERYLLHNIIDKYKEMITYQEHCDFLGMKSLSQDIVEDLTAQRNSLIERFGKSFAKDYGWAGCVGGNPEPSLVDLEKSIEVEHIRPFVKDANRNVHASSRGTMFRLGLSADSEVLLAGPSFHGIDIPGRNTAYSLSLLTVTLLTYQVSFSDTVSSKIITKFMTDIYDAFNEVEAKINK